MNKSDLKVLEQAFLLEIDGRMLQRDSGQIKRLALHGYLEPVTASVGRGWPQVKCQGYVLTHKGRLAYCKSCT